MLAVHLMLEMFSTIVSLLVVIMALNMTQRSGDDIAKTLIYGFTVIAGADLIHALTYDGMPALLTESSTQKAIFFGYPGAASNCLRWSCWRRGLGCLVLP